MLDRLMGNGVAEMKKKGIIITVTIGVILSLLYIYPLITMETRSQLAKEDRLVGEAGTLADNGNYLKSIAIYRKLLDQVKNNPRFIKKVHNNFAWILATCPEASVRNGKEAVKHAKLGDLTCWQDLDTLAAAYAENGNFDESIKTISEAIEMAPKNAHARLYERKKLYSKHKPYRCQPKNKLSSLKSL